jgi:hypothetical protein
VDLRDLKTLVIEIFLEKKLETRLNSESLKIDSRS